MFQKLATNVFNATKPRAGFSHTQTAQFRTVLQFSPSYPPSPLPPTTPYQPNSLLADNGNAGSSYNGSDRSGESKRQKFEEGYTGPGRAVTQANAFLNYWEDAKLSSEETEELEAKLPRSKDTAAAVLIARCVKHAENTLQRRKSMALGFIGPSKLDRAHTLGILSAVKSHVRQQHTFISSPLRPTDSKADSPSASERTAASPLEARHASSLATNSADRPDTTGLPDSLLRPVDAASSIPPIVETPPTPAIQLSPWASSLQAATRAKDRAEVVRISQEFLNGEATAAELYTESNYALLLHSLTEIHASGEPINLALELYNHLINRSIAPTLPIYAPVIKLLCERDSEIHRASAKLQSSIDSLKRSGADRAIIAQDESALKRILNEANFQSALTLFNAATAGLNLRFSTATCNALLKACGNHQNAEAAVRVFAHLERRRPALQGPDFLSFYYLIRAFGSVGDVGGASEGFKELKKFVDEKPEEFPLSSPYATAPWHAMMQTYFKAGMPEEAISLLEQMLSLNGSAPVPVQRTYSAVVVGFCQLGDLNSARIWFDRLLAAEPTATLDPPEEDADLAAFAQSAGSLAPQPPTREAWTVLLSALYKQGDLERFAKYYDILAASQPTEARQFVAYFLELTKRVLPTWAPFDRPVDAALTSLSQAVMGESSAPAIEQTLDLIASTGRVQLLLKIVNHLIGMQSSNVPELIKKVEFAAVRASAFGLTSELSGAIAFSIIKLSADATVDPYYDEAFSNVALSAVLKDNYVSFVTEPKEVELLALGFTRQYLDSKLNDEASHVFKTFVLSLSDIVTAPEFPIDVKERIVGLIGAAFLNKTEVYSEIEMVEMLKPFGDEAIMTYTSSSSRSESGSSVQDAFYSSHDESTLASPVSGPFLPPPAPSVSVGESITRFLEDFCAPDYSGVQAHESYTRLITSIQHGLYPAPATTAKYLGTLAKHGMYDQAKHVYTLSHPILEALSYDKQWQAQGWFQIEDGMMNAAATAGDVIAANVHRQRIIEQGGAPSAASYAALIVASKSMTDDATAASTLFAESQALGVKAHTYLYNVVISALSRARRADEALALFEKMKSEGVRWSSVTYGALIGACTRIGNEQAAKNLFEEMLAHPGLKPRVPPFNTMIQMYVQIKPDRDQALYYYQKMLQRRIRPTAHTYKLLMDCYGAIEPIQLTKMEQIFHQLEKDPDVQVGGPHFASLINAHGCIAKDLNKAIETFESIATRPYVQRMPIAQRLPDPVCYEALINVFVSHRRPDLVRQYLERLQITHVHMTAYVANLVIKAMAQCGDMEGARSLFESLEDPPSGLAGHCRHNHNEDGEVEVVQQSEGPVFREPSTWEAMVRAELGAGDRARAQELLGRMETRFYPEMVLQRVRSLVYPVEEFIHAGNSAL